MKRQPVSTTEKIARIMIALIIVLAGFLGAFLDAPPAVRAESSWCGTYFNDMVAVTSGPGSGYRVMVWNSLPSEFTAGTDTFYEGTTNNILLAASGDLGGIDVLNGSSAGDVRVFEYSSGSGAGFVGLLFTLAPGGDDHIPEGVVGILVDKPTGEIATITIGKSCAATPTPSPTYATPLPPQPTACVAATARPTATQQKTPTPLAFSTLVPTHTPTPGGPTATPTPAVTGTPLPPSEFDSGVAAFDGTLSPWTILTYDGPNEFEIGASWSNAIGADQSRPGTAFLPYQIDSTALTRTVAPAGAIVFALPSSATLPLRFTGEFMSDPVPAFHFNYIQVFYFDRDYNGPGQGVWSEIGIQPVSAIWQRLDFTIPISISAGSGRVAAIALQGISSGTPVGSEGGLTPGGYTFDSRTAGALADNLRIASGPHAVPNSFPICPGPGGNTPPPPTTKICIVLKLPVDVYGRCAPPSNPADLIGWIKYQICRILTYFDFVDANRQQVADLASRQTINEPLGSVIEMSDVTDVIGSTAKDILTVNQTNAMAYRTVEWNKLFNFRQLDAIGALLHKPAIDPLILQQYRDRCPKLPDDNANTHLFNDYGCLVVTFVRDQTPIVSIWQWVMDISSIIGVVVYVRSTIKRTQ